jgi:hypothetical protein
VNGIKFDNTLAPIKEENEEEKGGSEWHFIEETTQT